MDNEDLSGGAHDGPGRRTTDKFQGIAGHVRRGKEGVMLTRRSWVLFGAGGGGGRGRHGDGLGGGRPAASFRPGSGGSGNRGGTLRRGASAPDRAVDPLDGAGRSRLSARRVRRVLGPRRGRARGLGPVAGPIPVRRGGGPEFRRRGDEPGPLLSRRDDPRGRAAAIPADRSSRSVRSWPGSSGNKGEPTRGEP